MVIIRCLKTLEGDRERESIVVSKAWEALERDSGSQRKPGQCLECRDKNRVVAHWASDALKGDREIFLDSLLPGSWEPCVELYTIKKSRVSRHRPTSSLRLICWRSCSHGIFAQLLTIFISL